MEIRFTLTPQEYREGYGLLLRNSTFQCRFSYWFRTWLGPVLGLWILACCVEILAGNGSFPLVLILAVVGVVALAAPLRFRVAVRKIYRLQKLDQEIEVTAEADALLIKRAARDAETRYGWSAIEKSVESKRLVVLLPSKIQFIPIPKRAMTPEQQQELRALLAAHIPQAGAPLPAVS